jgi:hypothetical protein
MAKVTQLTVTAENRPGTLAHAAKVLADAKVNVLALLGSTADAQGSVQVVVDNVNRAKKALGGAGLSYTEGTLEQFETGEQAPRDAGRLAHRWLYDALRTRDSGGPAAPGSTASSYARSRPPVRTRTGNDRERIRAAQVRRLSGRLRGIGDVCEQGPARPTAPSPTRGWPEAARAAETASSIFRLWKDYVGASIMRD